jgi:acyl-CoA thioesterase I
MHRRLANLAAIPNAHYALGWSHDVRGIAEGGILFFWKSLYRPTLATSIVTLLFALMSIDPASAASVNIVCIGSSNTVGVGVSTAEAYPAQIQAMLRAKGIDANVTVRAAAGQGSAYEVQAAESVPADTKVVTYEPNVPNDKRLGVSESQNQANLARLSAGLSARGIKSVLIKIGRTLPDSEFQADHEHLTPHGHRALATRYLSQIIAAIGGAR